MKLPPFRPFFLQKPPPTPPVHPLQPVGGPSQHPLAGSRGSATTSSRYSSLASFVPIPCPLAPCLVLFWVHAAAVGRGLAASRLL